MKGIRAILIISVACCAASAANATVLWDQRYQEPCVGGAGAMFLGMSVLEEYLCKADDFILDASIGTRIETVTVSRRTLIVTIRTPR